MTIPTTPRIAGILLLALASAAACRGRQDPTPQKSGQSAVPVVAAIARRADVPEILVAIGNVEALSTVSIKTMIGGELTQVHFSEGQEVRKGEGLFSIDARPYEAALHQAEANLARDRAQLDKARTDEKRYSDLVAKDYVTREQYDAARTSVAALEATVKADEAAIETARVNLSYCTIRSPLNGRIGKLMIWAGNVVKANDVPIVTINQTRPIYVSFAVPDSRLNDIRRRMAEATLQVEALSPDSGDAPALGTLAFIDNAVDRTTGTILLRGLFPNEDGKLWPGQFVNVRLVLGTRAGATVVPSEAVQTSQQGTFVFMITNEKKAEMRPVTIGASSGPDMVIEKGIAAGEQVVTEGQLRLIPGSPVEIKTNGGGKAS